VEEPHRPGQMQQLLDHYGDLKDHLMLASDYPHWDGDNPDVVLPSHLPAEWKRRIQFENASELYGLR
jgi:predicted TIM-barrel fold metal-dependent hydrolase